MTKNSGSIRHVKQALFAIAFASISACGFGSEKRVALGEYCYAIPKDRILNSTLKEQLKDLPLDRTVAQVHLEFSPQYVAEKIPNFSPWIDGSTSPVEDTLTVIVGALASDNVAYIESGIHDEELWRAAGSYSNERLGQAVSWDENVELYRVYRAKISGGWAFVDMNPDEIGDQLPHSNHVIAQCHGTERMGRENYSCTHSNLRGYLHIQYSLAKENFPFYREIDDFVFAELESWKIGTLAEAGCLPEGS